MNGGLARATRRVLGMRVLCAFGVCVLTAWFASMVGTYRRPGFAQTFGVLLGASLLALALLRLVQRLRTAVRPSWLVPVLDHADRLALLLVVNLMLLTMLPGLPVAPLMPLGGLAMELGLPMVARVSAGALYGLFIAGIVGLLAVLVLRAGERAASHARWLHGTFRVADRAVLVAIVGYWLYGIALAFNGSLDRSPAVEHRTRIVGSAGIERIQWADVESWHTPGTTERVLIFVEEDRDDLWRARVFPGQPVVVRLHAGLLGMPWVERMSVDQDRNLEALVAVAPTAATPRKRLVQALLREQRWDDALAHTRAYMEHYPDDHTFTLSVATSLRAAGRAEQAKLVDPHARQAVGGRNPS